MIFSNFRRRAVRGERSSASAPRIPAGLRAYAIGDVHGRDDLLGQLLREIGGDIDRRPLARNHVVVLGDLIDRGPNSREVIERLRKFKHDGCELHVISGNHEEVLLRLLEGETGILWSWFKIGGLETLNSYGFDVEQLRSMEEADALTTIKAGIPPAHQLFLQDLADTVRVGDYLFVHAGIRPGVELEAQTPNDLRWIREPFLSDNSDHGYFVVHGHTISEDVVERVNRMGIDTGAYSTGRLTALALEGEQRWILEAAS